MSIFLIFLIEIFQSCRCRMSGSSDHTAGCCLTEETVVTTSRKTLRQTRCSISGDSSSPRNIEYFYRDAQQRRIPLYGK